MATKIICGTTLDRGGAAISVLPDTTSGRWPARPGEWVALNGFACRALPARVTSGLVPTSADATAKATNVLHPPHCWADATLYEALHAGGDAPAQFIKTAKGPKSLIVSLSLLPSDPPPAAELRVTGIAQCTEGTWVRVSPDVGHPMLKAPLFLSAVLCGRVVAVEGGKGVLAVDFLGQTLRVSICVNATPTDIKALRIVRTTIIHLALSEPSEDVTIEGSLATHLISSCNGLHSDTFLTHFAEEVERCLSLSDTSNSPIGVLLEGLSGSGKSFLCSALRDIISARNTMLLSERKGSGRSVDKGGLLVCEVVDLQECFRGDRVVGGGRAVAAAVLKGVFAKHAQRSGIVILEHLETLSVGNDVERIGVLQLCRELERLYHTQGRRIMVLATCTAYANIPQILLGPCRLAAVHTLGAASLAQRCRFLTTFGKLPNDQADRLARDTPAATAADLKEIVLKGGGGGGGGGVGGAEDAPAVPSEWLAKCFEKVVGCDSIVDMIGTVLLSPLTSAASTPLIKGILIHGPPGTGKTEIARCIVNMLCNGSAAGIPRFQGMEIAATSVVSKVIGESEANLHNVFVRARSNAPCVIVIDQFEALAMKRGSAGNSKALDRTLSTLLTELDGAEAHNGPPVLVVACTSQRHLLDPAILRSGRLDIHLATPSVDESQAKALLLRLLLPYASDGPTLETFVDLSNPPFTTYAEVVGVAEAAKMAALRTHINNIKAKPSGGEEEGEQCGGDGERTEDDGTTKAEVKALPHVTPANYKWAAEQVLGEVLCRFSFSRCPAV